MTETLLRSIKMRFARLDVFPWGCRMVYPIGSVDSTPHDTPHYHVIAHRCGYGDDVMRYCVEHEFAHEFMANQCWNVPSMVLSKLAEGKMISGPHGAYEEIAAQSFQRWLRANERPIIGGMPWDAMKAEALEMLDG